MQCIECATVHIIVQVDILCTHPMFGPDSGRDAWTGLNFMYEKVRIGSSKQRQQRCDAFLKVCNG